MGVGCLTDYQKSDGVRQRHPELVSPALFSYRSLVGLFDRSCINSIPSAPIVASGSPSRTSGTVSFASGRFCPCPDIEGSIGFFLCCRAAIKAS